MILTSNSRELGKIDSVSFWDSFSLYTIKFSKVMAINMDYALQSELENFYHKVFEFQFYNGKLLIQAILDYKRKFNTSIILLNINENYEDILLIQNLMFTETYFKVIAVSKIIDEEKLRPIVEAGFCGWMTENTIKNNLTVAIENISFGNRFYFMHRDSEIPSYNSLNKIP